QRAIVDLYRVLLVPLAQRAGDLVRVHWLLREQRQDGERERVGWTSHGRPSYSIPDALARLLDPEYTSQNSVALRSTQLLNSCPPGALPDPQLMDSCADLGPGRGPRPRARAGAGGLGARRGGRPRGGRRASRPGSGGCGRPTRPVRTGTRRSRG